MVVGTITHVAKDTGGMDIPPAGGEGNHTNKKVPFDSPTAHWRRLSLTVAVTDTLAGPTVQTLTLNWSVMGSTDKGEDADAIGRALMDLGTVMIASKAAPSNTTGRTRVLADPWTALAQVAADGTLSFPLISAAHGFGAAIGTGDAQDAFTNGVDTVEEVRQAAAKPTWQAPKPSWSSVG